MRVLITGLPLFSKQLATHLSEADPKSKFLFFDTYYSKWGKFRFLINLPFCSHVISMNGVSDNSGVLNWVLSFKKKLILQWMGTDSLLAMERYKSGAINRKYIDYGVNAIDSQWLEDELKSIEIQPIWLRWKFSEIEMEPVSVYDGIRVVTYVAQNRQLFYGLHWVVIAAKAFPEIVFEVYGTDTPDLECPENVKLKGWQPANVFREAVRTAPIFLRFTEHDGFSVSIIEALSTGAEVLATLPFEMYTTVDSEDKIVPEIQNAMERIKSRNFQPDLKTRSAALAYFNKEKVLDNYVQKLKAIGN